MKRKIRNSVLLLVCVMISTTGLFAQKKDIRDKESIARLHQLMDSYQYRQASLVADQLLRDDSLNIDLLILKGRALAADFQGQQAMAVFIRAHLVDTANVTALFELVNVCKQLGDWKQAIAYCRRLVDLHPESSFFTIQLSNLYYGTDDFRMAKEILLPLYRLDTLNAYVLKQLANSYNELQQADSAIHYYVKYLDLVPFDAVITGKLTNLLIRVKDYTAGLYLTELFLAHDSIKTGILKLNGNCNYL